VSHLGCADGSRGTPGALALSAAPGVHVRARHAHLNIVTTWWNSPVAIVDL
jgi:hypothetical protein